LGVSFDAIVERIRQRHGEDAVRRVLEGVEEAIKRDPRLTRFGALLLVANELGYLRSEVGLRSSLRIGELVGGLRSVSVVGRVLGVKGPLERGTRRMAVLRISDGTGSIDVVAWGSAADLVSSSGLRAGQAVRVVGARTREAHDGGLELHLDEGSRIEAAEHHEVPELEELVVRRFPAGAGKALDLMATVVGLSGERTYAASGKELGVRDALLSVDGALVYLSVWSNHVEGTDALEEWTDFLLTSLRQRDGELSTTPRTCVTRLSPSGPEEALGPLRVVTHRPDFGHLLTNGKSYLLARGSVPGPGAVISVRSCRFVREGRHWWLEIGDYRELQGAEVPEPEAVPLSDLRKGMRGIAVSGKILNKSQLSEVRTSSGKVATLAFWLSSGERSVYCRAWREAAELISSVPEGAWVRLRYVRVETDRYGEMQVTVDPESDVVTES